MSQQNRYYAYIRVSTTKQGEKGVSLQEQREAISVYAKQHDLQIVEWFEERVTAAKRGRKEFSQMLTHLRKGRADGVLMHKIDRSARNLRDWADLGELIDAGIDVQFANESLDLNSRGGRLAGDIQAVVAADFIRNLREETRKGFYGRLKQGYYPLRAPIGYLDRGGGKAKEFDPERAPLVRRLFELYATGRHTLKSLRRVAESMGLRNRRGGKLSLNGISTILNNPFYIGIMRIKTTGETFQGNHEPLISAATFHKVKSILKGKTNTRSIKHDFLFRRIIQCSKCGYSIIGERQKGHIYYRCHTSNCPTKSVREENINAKVMECIAPLQFNPHEWLTVESELEAFNRHCDKVRREAIDAHELRLSRIDNKLNRLVDALLEGLVAKDIYERRKSKLLMAQREITDRVKVLESERGILTDEVTEYLERAGTAKTSYLSGDRNEKRELLEIITSNRSLDGKTLQFERSFPFQFLAERSKNNHCDQQRNTPRMWNDIINQLVRYVIHDKTLQSNIDALGAH